MIIKRDQRTITQKIIEEYGKSVLVSIIITDNKIYSIKLDSNSLPSKYLNYDDTSVMFLLFYYHPKEMQELFDEIEDYIKNEKHT
jgi:hypothetical protein